MGFFRSFGVDIEESNISFALSTLEVEWASRGLEAVLVQPGIWRSPKFHRLIYEVVRFGQLAPEVLSDPKRWQVAAAHRLPGGSTRAPARPRPAVARQPRGTPHQSSPPL